MFRRFVAILVLMVLPASVGADGIGERIAAQLRAQGFTRIEFSRTLLGRARIVAESSEVRREIVYNPRTGLIMRDYSTAISEQEGDGPGFSLMAIFGRERASVAAAANRGGRDGNAGDHGRGMGDTDGDGGGDSGDGDSDGDGGGDGDGDGGGDGDGDGGGDGDGDGDGGGDGDGDGDGGGDGDGDGDGD